MKRMLSALSLLLCLCLMPEASAQNYDNLEPLTLLNRSVLDKSHRAIQRDDITVRDAAARLISEADRLMQNPIPSPTAGDTEVLKTVCGQVRTLGEAYYLTRQEKYAARVYDYIRPWMTDAATRLSPRLPADSDFVAMSNIIDLLDGYLLTDGSKAWNSTDDTAMRQWFDELLGWLRSDDMMAGMKQLDDYQGIGYDMLLTASKTFFEREWLHEMKVFVDATTKARLDRILAADGKMMIGTGNTVLAETEHLVTLVRMALMAEKAGSNLWLYETKSGGSIRRSIEWLSNLLLSDNAWVKRNDARSIARGYTYVLLSAACPLTSKKLYEERLNTLASMMEGREDIGTLSYQLTSPIVYGTLLGDEDFFDTINLDTPGLETVKADIASGDIAKAKSEFVSYLRGREYRFDWNNADNSSDTGSYDITEVTNTVNNLLMGEQFGDTVIWTRNNTPLEYEEWPWQLGRHQYWIGLGRAYKATGDEQYARAFVNQLKSWIDQSPLPDYDAKIDYSRWRTIETGIRTLGSWPMAYLYFLQSPSFDDESVFLMMKSFYEHAIHLRKHHRTNNWLSMEMNGLMHIALLFPEFKEAAHWAEYAGTKIYQETEIQVYPDGAQVELAPGYHGATLSNFLGLYSIAKATGYEGLPKDFSQKLENMYGYYVKIMAPSGEMPAVNDSGWNDARAKLAQGLGLFPGRADFQYIATGGKEGTKPSFTSTWMPWAGWYMMRSGWGENDLYAHFEVGPYSPGHQHEDKLSLILYAYGKRLITEGGTYSYDTSDWRKYILSARAHNVSKVDGKYQNRHDYEPEADLEYSREPMANRWVSNDDCDFGEGWYDEGFGDEAGRADRNVEQYRALTFIKDRYWILFDIFTPKDGTSHQYDSYFHFNTDRYLMDGNCVMSDDEGANIAIIPLRKDAKVWVISGQTDPELQGWLPLWTEDGYVYNPVATPTFSYNESGQSVSAYILYPMKAGGKNPVKSVHTKGDTIEVRFADGGKDCITFSVEGNRLKTLTFKSKDKQFSILK
ncbi:MAG: alginate lyase family protein [Bacteroidales bacterium]|nr:alginate lyase family protein [Candidatus Cacconaster scatequi]